MYSNFKEVIATNFLYTTTAVLSWYVKQFFVIQWQQNEWQQVVMFHHIWIVSKNPECNELYSSRGITHLNLWSTSVFDNRNNKIFFHIFKIWVQSFIISMMFRGLLILNVNQYITQ